MKKSLSISVLSTINLPSFLNKTKSLAARLSLPYHQSAADTISDFFLIYTETGLQFCRFANTDLLIPVLYIDFVKGKNGYRHSKSSTIRQPLAKAVGIKPGVRPSVFDATAGLGRDAFVLACLGCAVSLCERSPILHCLLEDGLFRAGQFEKTREIVSTKMKLLFEDSKIHLQNNPHVYHTVYLDPMYPHRTNSALNKLEMRVIRDLVGDDEDGDILLELAFGAAQNRVVVKRPKGARKISDWKPSFSVPMKNSRYDIYLVPERKADSS